MTGEFPQDDRAIWAMKRGQEHLNQLQHICVISIDL